MLITLTTDFGTRDPYVGIMKGVIARIAPQARVIDITHEIQPQNLHHAALVLDSLLDYFPATTIHVAVVDPTVGSDRAGIAVQTDRFIFIGPDNGIFTSVLARQTRRAAVTLTNREYHLHPTSSTFHGRDIFAPVTAHLAAGVPLAALGEPIATLVALDLPQPVVSPERIEAHVVYVDHFGNLITDLTRDAFAPWRRINPSRLVIEVKGVPIDGIARTFADVRQGDYVAYFGSSERLEIAVRSASAAAHLGVVEGDRVRVRAV